MRADSCSLPDPASHDTAPAEEREGGREWREGVEGDRREVNCRTESSVERGQWTML